MGAVLCEQAGFASAPRRRPRSGARRGRHLRPRSGKLDVIWCMLSETAFWCTLSETAIWQLQPNKMVYHSSCASSRHVVVTSRHPSTVTIKVPLDLCESECTQRHTDIHTYIRTYMHTQTDRQTDMNIYIYIYNTDIHTHTDIHTYILSIVR